MKVKKESCKYCSQKIEAKTTRAEFCSDKCRVYWNREHPKVSLKNFNKTTNDVKSLTPKPETSDYTINTEIPNMPTRIEGEDVFDFAARKNEWKRLYNK